MATRKDREGRYGVQGTRGQGMSGEEFRRDPGRNWNLPPTEMFEHVSPNAPYKEFIRLHNAHVDALNTYIKDELDRIWENLND